MDKFKKIKLHPENPIEVPDKEPFKNDFLGFELSVMGLSQIIDRTETPFTLGIFGSWGSGKTSFMRMLQTQLTKENYETFWFDAWQYENENSLLLPLLSKLAKDCKPEKTAKNKFRKIGNVALFTVTNAFLKKITLDTIGTKDISEQIKVYEEKIGEAYYNYVSQIDSQKEEFRALVSEIKNDKPALIIFIDDLDRCMPENAVRLIENIKHFLSVEGCIFILGVDKDVLSKGIQARYGSQLISGDEYLEKIINLSFFVPYKMGASKDFILETFKKFAEPDWYKEISEEIEKFNKIFSIIGIDNPRKTRLLIFRYLLFLTLDDYHKYIKEIVIKLIVYREFFPEAYDLKKKNGLVNFTPEFGIMGSSDKAREMSFDEMAQRSCEDFAKILKNEKYTWLAAFSAETAHKIKVFNIEYPKIKTFLQNHSNNNIKRLIEEFIESDCKRTHQDYFDIVDFLFSFS